MTNPVPPYQLFSLLSDHMADSAALAQSLNKIAPAKLVMSDKRLKAEVYHIKYCAAEILTALREAYPDLPD